MKQIEWKITNRLRDGTEIKRLPLTTQSEKVLRQTAEIVKAATRKEAAA